MKFVPARNPQPFTVQSLSVLFAADKGPNLSDARQVRRI
jgi:hypothetical protein